MSHQNFIQLFNDRVNKSATRVALKEKVDGRWVGTTWTQWQAQSQKIAAFLLSEGIQRGDRVGILANSSAAWVISDIAILMAGGASVTVYQSNTPEQVDYIVNNSGLKVLLIEDPHQLEKVTGLKDQLKEVTRIVHFKDACSLERPDHKGRSQVNLADIEYDEKWAVSWNAALEQGAAYNSENPEALSDIATDVKSDELATVVYTSGTTGPPKGVMLTHDSFIFEATSVNGCIDLTEEDEQLLFLPLAHIFAKVLYLSSVGAGSSMAFAESVAKVIPNIGEIRPSYMGAVPRIYEKVYSKVLQGVQEAGGIKEKIFNWSVSVGRKVSLIRQSGKEPSGFLALKYAIATKLVFGKLQQKFGGRLKYFVSGGAPLSREIAEFFHAAGILILEGYGLTETTAATNINLPTNYKFGTVGPVLPGCEMKIASDGEIMLKGRNVLVGYWQNESATKEVLSEDGWFATGDIGEIDDDGFLRITDRKKDIIVTAGGKNVAPQNIENTLKLSPIISQVMVHGDKRKFLAALITLDELGLKEWAASASIAETDYAALTKHPKVYEMIDGEVASFNKTQPSYETIKKFVILDKDFTVEDSELTPSLKVKRKEVEKKYKSILDNFYTESF